MVLRAGKEGGPSSGPICPSRSVFIPRVERDAAVAVKAFKWLQALIGANGSSAPANEGRTQRVDTRGLSGAAALQARDEAIHAALRHRYG